MRIALRRYTHNGDCVTNTDLTQYITKSGFYIIDTLNKFVYAKKEQVFISDMITINFYSATETKTTIINHYPSKLSENKLSKQDLLKYKTINQGDKQFIGKNLNANIRIPKFYHHPILTFYNTNTNNETKCFDIEICGENDLNEILPKEIPKIKFEPLHNYICLYINGSLKPDNINLYLGRRIYKNNLCFGVSHYICKKANDEIINIKPIGTKQKMEPYTNDYGLKCYDKHIAYILIFEPMIINLLNLMNNYEKIGILDK